MECVEIKIRQMEPSDVDDVVNIEADVYGEHHWSKDSFYNELTNNVARYYSVFDSNNQLVAYAGTWEIIDEAHITNIAVKKEFQGKKIGEALLTHILKQCYSSMIKYLTLEVRVSNRAAINLYEKYGFQSLGLRKGYYQNNNEDAIIMWTENIFWDKFKERFEENIKILSEKIKIL